MDKSRLSNPEKLQICRRYYILGFFCLPVVWTLNYYWFRHEASVQPEFDEQKEIQKLRSRSAIGATLWFVLVMIWLVTFQLNRVKWGEFGDNISFIIPTGSP